MKINLKATNIELTSAISEYLDKRLDGLEKFLPKGSGSAIVDVELGRTTNHHQSGDVFRAEINVYVDGKAFRAASELQELYAAIDDMKAGISRELSSFKDKKLSLLKRGGQKIKNLFRRFNNN